MKGVDIIVRVDDGRRVDRASGLRSFPSALNIPLPPADPLVVTFIVIVSSSLVGVLAHLEVVVTLGGSRMMCVLFFFS